jgi:hypothetical protein
MYWIASLTFFKRSKSAKTKMYGRLGRLLPKPQSPLPKPQIFQSPLFPLLPSVQILFAPFL